MKYSNGSILTRSDITILMQQVDVTKAYDLLAMFKGAGEDLKVVLIQGLMVSPRRKCSSAISRQLDVVQKLTDKYDYFD